jgi:hypothetical protein
MISDRRPSPASNEARDAIASPTIRSRKAEQLDQITKPAEMATLVWPPRT